MNDPPEDRKPLAGGSLRIDNGLQTATNPTAKNQAQQALANRAELPQFTDRRRFLVWAVLCGFVKPERMTERVVAEIESEFGP